MVACVAAAMVAVAAGGADLSSGLHSTDSTDGQVDGHVDGQVDGQPGQGRVHEWVGAFTVPRDSEAALLFDPCTEGLTNDILSSTANGSGAGTSDGEGAWGRPTRRTSLAGAGNATDSASIRRTLDGEHRRHRSELETHAHTHTTNGDGRATMSASWWAAQSAKAQAAKKRTKELEARNRNHNHNHDHDHNHDRGRNHGHGHGHDEAARIRSCLPKRPINKKVREAEGQGDFTYYCLHSLSLIPHPSSLVPRPSSLQSSPCPPSIPPHL